MDAITIDKTQFILYIYLCKRNNNKQNNKPRGKTMTNNTIIPTFNSICAYAESPEEMVRMYIKIFGEEIKKFGTAKCDDMSQPMVTLYNYIDSREFRKDCDDCIWEFINNMVTYAETYIWHKDSELYADDPRIEWIKQFI